MLSVQNSPVQIVPPCSIDPKQYMRAELKYLPSSEFVLSSVSDITPVFFLNTYIFYCRLLPREMREVWHEFWKAVRINGSYTIHTLKEALLITRESDHCISRAFTV
jgi:hypothetical protein